ncbi:MAG: helix-turn-helix transcriptional regulator [Deltaproteobacteria bacterium]|nr:helix-turn-helix transcriptional regulator [Deltaproteobacteria bacterium]
MTHTVTLVRGDLNSIVVPLSTFRPSGDGVKPDFSNFSIDDYGQTLKFGEYEASSDAVFYEFDPLYRRTRKAELAKKEKGFGASLRRLRLQKGLRQTDFSEIDAREIGRIERGEVKPRKATIEKIASTLNVDSTEITSY